MGVQMSSNPSVVKEGFVQRYKSGFLSSKWKSNYVVLYPDSTFAIYNERGDSRPSETIFLRNVVPYICVGFMTDRMPVHRPSLPSGTAVQRLVGIGMDPQASKVHWILFPSEQILEEWFNAIVTTLPKPSPQNPAMNANQGQQQPMPNGGAGPRFVPPAKYPDAPPPYGVPQNPPPIGMSQPKQPSYAYGGQQPSYGADGPQYPPQGQQTVIIDRRPAAGYGNYGDGGGSSGFGTGLAAGMGGALLGSLVGYGIGSMFAPHGGWGGYGGGGWGGGMGSGFGGGYIQDNDTYVTNNYYYNNTDGDGDTNTTPAQNAIDQGDYTEPTQNDYNDVADYDGGGGTWDDGGGWGGDDGGGFDGGGGDW